MRVGKSAQQTADSRQQTADSKQQTKVERVCVSVLDGGTALLVMPGTEVCTCSGPLGR